MTLYLAPFLSDRFPDFPRAGLIFARNAISLNPHIIAARKATYSP